DVARDALCQFHFRRRRREDVAADVLDPDDALHVRYFDHARDRLGVDARRGGERYRVVHRHAAVAIVPATVGLGAHLDAAGALGDFDVDAIQVGPAARVLDRLDRDFVAAAAGDRDVTRDVGNREAAVAADPDPAREPVG